MPSVLLDTHAWVWSFAAQNLLSKPALTAIEEADAVYVSPLSFFEIGQKVRVGKWPEMADTVSDLPQILADQGGFLVLSQSLRIWACLPSCARRCSLKLAGR